MKDILVRAACALMRFYLRYMPVAAGKKWLWKRVVKRHLAWRPMAMVAGIRRGPRLSLRFPDEIQTYLYFFGVWEPLLTRYVESVLRPGDVFIDIGANIGYYTLLASKLVGPSGTVVAIEASPSIYQRLIDNVERNAAHVTAHHIAVVDRSCRIPIYRGPEDNIGRTSAVAAHSGRERPEIEAEVDGRPLGLIVPPDLLAHARLIKIDVEGAEWHVVQGMKGLLGSLSARTELVVEIKAEALKEAGGSVDAFLEIFTQAGFRPFEIANDYDLDIYLERRPLELPPLTNSNFRQKDIVFKRA
jgi:FkbM family methyltransferase